MLVEGRRARAIHAPRVDAVDTVGAGDGFASGVITSLLEGLDDDTTTARATRQMPDARIRAIASPQGACCVERLLEPYPSLLVRQLARMHESR